MVRPHWFAHNEQTAGTNAFQKEGSAGRSSSIREQALLEFDLALDSLRSDGVDALVLDDSATPVKPDAIFPNNWFSTHASGELVLYPMFAPNRRWERRDDLVEVLAFRGRLVSRVVDLTSWECEGEFLEGTGSLVLDRQARIAYACRSPRTSERVLGAFASELGYTPCLFDAFDAEGQPVYHTNVVMCVGSRFAVLGSDCLPNGDRLRVVRALEAAGREVIHLSPVQIARFAGNMLEVATPDGPRIVLSATAMDSLTTQQRDRLEALSGSLLPLAIPTIQHFGGGSARCMLAEIFLPRVSSSPRS